MMGFEPRHDLLIFKYAARSTTYLIGSYTSSFACGEGMDRPHFGYYGVKLVLVLIKRTRGKVRCTLGRISYSRVV